jgi:hypothetical protein
VVCDNSFRLIIKLRSQHYQRDRLFAQYLASPDEANMQDGVTPVPELIARMGTSMHMVRVDGQYTICDVCLVDKKRTLCTSTIGAQFADRECLTDLTPTKTTAKYLFDMMKYLIQRSTMSFATRYNMR